MGKAQRIPMRLYLVWPDLRDGESGQALVEYALILSLVSVAAIGALNLLSGGINGIFTTINNSL